MFGLSRLLRRDARALPEHPRQPLYLHDTKRGALVPFEPLKPDTARLYHCGPTVYGEQHIGNMRSYVFADLLRRTLEYNRYSVRQIINITDVGHLTSDADEGEDKMSTGLKREGLELTLKNMQKLGERYAKLFEEDLERLNVETPDAFPRASEHIEAQIALLKTLDEKGYAYTTDDGVYFDTSRFSSYGKLGNISLEAQQTGERIEGAAQKRNPADFALWKFDDKLGWESPWGKGFPGWHLECSAMAMQYLGKSFDIHTGGTDHIPVHHNNEMAQSESATGKPFATYWLHHEHIGVEGRKISKSLGNTIYLHNVIDRGYSPLAFRYWLLGAHYRSPMNFTWEALDGAQTALRRLHTFLVEEIPEGARAAIDNAYRERFHSAMNDDLDAPKALAILWELVKDKGLSPATKRATLLDMDRVLGIGLIEADTRKQNLVVGADEKPLEPREAPPNVRDLLKQREEARKTKEFDKADELRQAVEKAGFFVEDTPDGPRLRRVS